MQWIAWLCTIRRCRFLCEDKKTSSASTNKNSRFNQKNLYWCLSGSIKYRAEKTMFSTHAFSTVAKFLRLDSIFIKSIAELSVKEFTAKVLYKKVLVLRVSSSPAKQINCPHYNALTCALVLARLWNNFSKKSL